MDDNELDERARILDEAARTATAVPQLSVTRGEIDVAAAQEVQRRSVQRRLDGGERQVGLKMGFTSRAKMAQMGVDDLIWGRLTDALALEDGGELDLGTRIHPRFEPEVAFLMKRPLSGVVSPAQALAAVEAVCVAVEVIDSRYADFKFSLADVIADNTSAAGFALGPWRDPSTDLSNLGMVVEVDGRVVQTGSTAAILGHPLRSLAAASRVIGEAGGQLEAGWVVLAGGATAATWIEPDTHLRVEAEALGAVDLHVTGG